MINSSSQESRVNSQEFKHFNLWSVVCRLCTKKGFSLIEVLVVLSLMALAALFLGSKINNMGGKGWRFNKTCQIMEEIKEAIIGRPGLYCNCIRQYTGYVSDVGGTLIADMQGNKRLIPISLFYKEGKVIKKLEMKDNISNIFKQGHYPQPMPLWTRKVGEIPEWKYYGDAETWSGWRGPYIDLLPDDVLKDAWGNPFVFIIGEVGTHNEKAYRCVKTHDAGLGTDIDSDALEEPHEPGTSDGDQYWEELPININPKPWIHPGKLQGIPDVVDTYYDDALEMISLGADGRPGGKGVNKDLVITIYKQEWTGEVSGHVGYRGNPYVTEITLYCPKKGEIESAPIEIVDNDHGSDIDGEIIYCGISFRFGTAPMATGICLEWEQQCQEYDDSGNCIDDVDVCVEHEVIDEPKPDSNWEKVAVPIGIRSLQAGGKTYIFPVEATGNWVGTIK